jgi:hypothetical protein
MPKSYHRKTLYIFLLFHKFKHKNPFSQVVSSSFFELVFSHYLLYFIPCLLFFVSIYLVPCLVTLVPRLSCLVFITDKIRVRFYIWHTCVWKWRWPSWYVPDTSPYVCSCKMDDASFVRYAPWSIRTWTMRPDPDKFRLRDHGTADTMCCCDAS